MSHPPYTPILVGVGDIINRSSAIEQSVEPANLMLHAINIALQDTGLAPSSKDILKSQIDSIQVVRTWTWPYPDLPSLLADKLDITAKHLYCSPHGGNQPAKLVDEAARRIAKGESKVAVVTGGEALASLAACAKAEKLPPPGWTPVKTVAGVFSPTASEFTKGTGAAHGIGAPIQVYPLYENGLRAHRDQSIKDNNAESAKLYAEFAEVAAKNILAWQFVRPMETEESIDPLLMNAFNTINLAGACIMTSTQHAHDLGIPQAKWIYILGGAGTQDSDDFWLRPNYHSSPALSWSLDVGIKASGIGKDDIDMFDFYSCFPIVPKLACLHLGLPVLNPPKPISLLGGLTSFGGAGNNYSMHAITEMVRKLRSGYGKTGLVLANGGVLTYQHVICLSSQPRADDLSYPTMNLLPEVLHDDHVPPVNDCAEGEAVIETYTVDFNRNGKPERGYVVGRLQRTGHRFIANHGDEATLQRLSSNTEEPIGKFGFVKGDPNGKGRNLFYFDVTARL